MASARLIRLPTPGGLLRSYPRAPFSRLYTTPPAPLSTPTPPAKSASSSATAIFYRQLIPSMLHCLALGSIVYYALELTHNYLERELVVEELGARVKELEGQLEVVRWRADGASERGAEPAAGANGTRWWHFW